jgi:hypothetical protein
MTWVNVLLEPDENPQAEKMNRNGTALNGRTNRERRERQQIERQEAQEADRQRAEESAKRLDQLHRQKQREGKMSANDAQPTLSYILAKNTGKGERVSLSKEEISLATAAVECNNTQCQSAVVKANSIAAEAEHQKMKAQWDLFMEQRGLYNDVMGSRNPKRASRTLRQIQTLSA